MSMDAKMAAYPYHQVRIKASGVGSGNSNIASGKSLLIRSLMPQGGIGLNFSSSWAPLFGQPGNFKNTIAEMGSKAIQAIGGYTLFNQALTTMKWVGHDNIGIALKLQFIVDSDPISELIQPIKNLIMLSLPYRGTGAVPLVSAPGPRIKADVMNLLNSVNGNANKIQFEGTIISLGIGSNVNPTQILSLDNVVIGPMRVNISDKLNHDGLPLEADVDVQLMPMITPIANDVDKMLFPGFSAGDSYGSN